MFYTVYRTRNLVNGKCYYGCHKTANPNDDYLGSGKLMLLAIAKYGPKNFVKDVLGIFLDNESGREAAFALEQEIVDREIGLPGCYNLKRGGDGGYDWINRNCINNKADNAEKATTARMKKFAEDPSFAEKMRGIAQLGATILKSKWKTDNKLREQMLEGGNRGRVLWNQTWKGHKHTKASSVKMSTAKQGSKNNLFGCHWMKHTKFKSYPVKASEVETRLIAGWTFGR